MTIELTKENIVLLKDCLLSEETVKQEWSVNPFAKYLIIIEENKVIGYLYYSDIYDRAEINQLEIDSFHRNCGKASILLQKMIETVDKNITLEVRKDNVIAIHLYQKFGFIEKATREKYYQDIDGILMERQYIKKSLS